MKRQSSIELDSALHIELDGGDILNAKLVRKDYKHLGTFCSSDFSMIPEIHSRVGAMNQAFTSLRRKFFKCSSIGMDKKLCVAQGGRQEGTET